MRIDMKNNNYCKGLNRRFLVSLCEWQVYEDLAAPYGWTIKRYWHDGHKKNWDWRDVRIKEVTCNHKYTGAMRYPAITLTFNCQHYSWSLSRFLFAYFKGEIPDGYVVDHKKPNQFDNRLDNLQLLTIKENNRKRFTDNPNLRVNQYGCKKKKELN